MSSAAIPEGSEKLAGGEAQRNHRTRPAKNQLRPGGAGDFPTADVFGGDASRNGFTLLAPRRGATPGGVVFPVVPLRSTTG